MSPVSSRFLTTDTSSTNLKSMSLPTAESTSTPPTSVPTPKPSTFHDAKRMRERAKPSRSGGGIFRPSGDHTIISSGEKTNIRLSSTVTPSSVNNANQKTPSPNGMPSMSLFNFTRAWESLNSVQERWKLMSVSSLSSYDPPNLIDLLSSKSPHRPCLLYFKTL